MFRNRIGDYNQPSSDLACFYTKHQHDFNRQRVRDELTRILRNGNYTLANCLAISRDYFFLMTIGRCLREMEQHSASVNQEPLPPLPTPSMQPMNLGSRLSPTSNPKLLPGEVFTPYDLPDPINRWCDNDDWGVQHKLGRVLFRIISFN